MADARLEAELIDQARLQISDPNAEVHRRMAVVTAVSLAGGTCSITIAGSATAVAGVRFLRDSVPQVNDVVWCIETGGDYLVIGTQAPGGATWTPGVSGGTWALNNGASSGTYQQVGGWCQLAGVITFGSSSNFGGGTALTVTGLPLAPRTGFNATLGTRMLCATTGYNGAWRVLAAATSGGADYNSEFGAPGAVFVTNIDATHPGVWATGNFIEIFGSYPV